VEVDYDARIAGGADQAAQMPAPEMLVHDGGTLPT
jgi:hypothetical protein